MRLVMKIPPVKLPPIVIGYIIWALISITAMIMVK
jgi:hypothetical protein